MQYRILSTIEIKGINYLWEKWKLFQCNPLPFSDLQIDIQLNTQWRYGLEVLNIQQGKAVLKFDEALLCVNEDWSKAQITLFKECREGVHKLLNALLLTHLSIKNTLEVHASLIRVHSNGILFLGPSGIGKTTQAELWMRYCEAEIINGDRVFVKQENEIFLGCGSPWHGSSPYCLNKQVPLSALIVLKQSGNNKIRRLSGFEMVSSVMRSVFFPTWYHVGYDAAYQTLDALLRTVPVYELSCRPDEDAVKLTEEAVFGSRL